MLDDKQAKLEQASREVWGHLEAGEWLGAMIAAGHVTGLDPDNKENLALARHIRKISEIADEVKGGPRRGAAARLEDIARSLPRLKEMSSFQALVASARYTSRKRGIVISVVVAIVFVLACNLAGYQYIQAQPVVTATGTQSTYQGWLGIQKLNKPVDILLLGDSACVCNLMTGAFADRLGGSVINLGNNAGSSLLTDAWMLDAYIREHGAPRVVVVTRTSLGYSKEHTLEYMASYPLGWDYWDEYGAVPEWESGEVRDLFVEKYGVLYSDADVLRERLIKPWNLFDYSVTPRHPTSSYSKPASTAEKEEMNVKARQPSYYFREFSYSVDSTNAIQCMAGLARKYNFQLYFTMQAEWDEAVKAGLRDAHLAAEKTYLSQFVDNKNVFIVEQSPKTLFSKEQMQSPNHLWHGSENIYTEEIVNAITEIQNKLTEKQAGPLEVKSISLDKDSYQPGDQPVITLNVANGGNATVNGSVSCLIKPHGASDANWVARATAVPMDMEGNSTQEITLQVTAGSLDTAGSYDVVVFLRQDIGGLSHETRVEVPNEITIN